MTNEEAKKIKDKCRAKNTRTADLILCDYDSCLLFKGELCDNWEHYVIDHNINLFEDLFG